MRGARVWRMARAHPAISMLGTVLALGLVPSLAWELTPKAEPLSTRTAQPDPRYASQGGSLHKGRASHVKSQGDEDAESAVETCAGVGLEHLAHRYRLRPDPELVARRFARGYELAFQPRVERACLHGLLHPGS